VLGVPPWALEKLLEVVEMLQGLTAPAALKHGGRRRDEPTAGGEELVTASGEGWGGTARIRARRG